MNYDDWQKFKAKNLADYLGGNISLDEARQRYEQSLDRSRREAAIAYIRLGEANPFRKYLPGAKVEPATATIRKPVTRVRL